MRYLRYQRYLLVIAFVFAIGQGLFAQQNAATTAVFDEDESDPLFALKREQAFYQQRAFPYANIPAGAYWKAQQQRSRALSRALRANSAALPFASVQWNTLGAASSISANTHLSGRTTSIAVDPSNFSTLYLGTAAGGVWKSSDAGKHWSPLTDSQPSLAIGAITVDPNNHNVIYAGTGEPDLSGDSYYGQGLLRSTDAGATWSAIRAPFASNASASAFSQIAVQPGNSNIVLAATFSGIYRSSDAGVSWSQVFAVGSTAVVFDNKHANVVFAGTGFFGNSAGPMLVSTDAGASWTPITGSGAALPQPASVLRTALTQDSSGNLYAAFAKSDFSSPGTLFKTSDGGKTWTQLTSPPGSLNWYENAIAVSPANSSVLYATGGGLMQSLDGGQTWAQVSAGYPDEHGLTFTPDGSLLFVGNDGGVFVSSNSTAASVNFQSLNDTLNTMTYYPGMAVVPGSLAVVGGTQDHGLVLQSGNTAWANTGFCGDAGSVYIDPQGQHAYAHCIGGNSTWITTANGVSPSATWVDAGSGFDPSDRYNWAPDIKGDPQNPAIVYAAANHLYQSINHGGSWTSISPDLSQGSSNINSIGVAPTDSNTVYTGTGDGVLSVTHNATAGVGATWAKMTNLPARSISKVLVSDASPADVYVAFGGFGAAHVYHTTDGGVTWSDLTNDLPDAPVNSIALDPTLPGYIYLATDVGVFFSSNFGGNWLPLGSGLPNVVVQDMLIEANTRTLSVITHGRGVWTAVLPSASQAGVLQVSASAISFGSQVLSSSSGSQSIQLSNTGGVAVGNLSAVISGANATDFTLVNNCGVTLTPGGSCTMLVTFAPSGVGSRSAVLAVTSNGVPSLVNVALSGTGQAPFTLTATNSSSTITAGSAATYQLTVTPASTLLLPVQFSCSGLPALTTCTFSPASVAAGAGATNVSLSVQTTAAVTHSAAIQVLSMCIFGVALTLSLRKRVGLALVCLMLVAGLMTACGNSGSGGSSGGHTTVPGTPSGTFPITVSAAQQGGFTTSTTVNLVVQ